MVEGREGWTTADLDWGTGAEKGGEKKQSHVLSSAMSL